MASCGLSASLTLSPLILPTSLSISSKPRIRPNYVLSKSFRCEAIADSIQREIPTHGNKAKNMLTSIAIGSVSSVAALAILLGNAISPAMAETAATPSETELTIYYGTAASASSYGGYGGNASKQYTAEYVYSVPKDWKERTISKVEKGTNGTDSEFFNPKKKKEKTYLTYLAGFRRLPPKDNVLNDIALSDVNLQDLIASADKISAVEREDPEKGQLYYDFEIDSPYGHSLISVTCAKNKLYAHFVNAPPAEWEKDTALLTDIHNSFKTVGIDPLGSY